MNPYEHDSPDCLVIIRSSLVPKKRNMKTFNFLIDGLSALINQSDHVPTLKRISSKVDAVNGVHTFIISSSSFFRYRRYTHIVIVVSVFMPIFEHHTHHFFI